MDIFLFIGRHFGWRYRRLRRSFGSHSHSGPFHHSWCPDNPEGKRPHEAQSTGLFELPTWFQRTDEIDYKIWESRFPVKVLNLRGFPRNQPSTVVLSVHVNVPWVLMFNAFCVCHSSWERSFAPHSSRRGMVSLFMGATFILAITSDVCTVSLLSWTRMYTAAT